MTPGDLKERDIYNELVFTASRSSGPGGQNVNKVSTKIELRFNISTSSQLSEKEKELLFGRLGKRINKDGELLLSSQKGRSQLSNRRLVTERFYEIVSAALTENPERQETVIPVSSRRERLDRKRIRGLIKKSRGRPSED
ncbi:MAG: aminoacyl-tRNA hydrolase [Bacteroidales bacterium]|jgi:ribosome-associated protein|nr:aminoacyl-tRNA hydrolase [Bacteroidales bacterium]MCU0408230.1 aminoacyl-tRNA hydrolase [Bacteroidales bacterium]